MDIRFSGLKQAMVRQLEHNSVVTNNLANINSNGYKRDVMFSDLMENNNKPKIQSHIETDFSQGDFRQTDNPLDMAISGAGLFTIAKGDELVFTRDGHFTRGSDGLLTTSSGLPVMGQHGFIDLGAGLENQGHIKISPSGEIFMNDEFIDTLEISSFENLSGIEKIGDNLFKAKQGAIESRVEDPGILQGKIEGSNVTPVYEMIKLIELQRAFETSQKTLRTLDEATGKAANNIGNYR